MWVWVEAKTSEVSRCEWVGLADGCGDVDYLVVVMVSGIRRTRANT